MKPDIKRSVSKAVMIMALFCMTTQPTLAALLNLAQTPLFAGSNIPPKVLLTISKDQQLYKKAYNDYTDLDGDGQIETNYKHAIDYYGYFDPKKCYTYSNPNQRFEPAGLANAAKYCPGQWSGNFLNWVSMSRMDAVRKLLYGGLRSTDQTSASGGVNAVTVLERAYLPTDAHAWAKHYNGADIALLTPFNPPIAPVPILGVRTQNLFTIPAVGGDYDIDFQNKPTVEVGDQIRMAVGAESFMAVVMSFSGSNNKIVRVRIDSVGISGIGTFDTWTLTRLSRTGISFCNLTKGAAAGVDQRSSTNTQPPTIRVAQGNFGLWNANERWQCQWFEERNNFQGGFPGGLRSNGNQAALSEINASAENPSQNGDGLGTGSAKGEFFARVQVCKPGLVGSEKCKVYPAGNLKPIGLLQEYGDRERIYFGLMTGSHAKNISGGVLRKNVGPLASGPESEVNANTDGTFVQPYRPPNPTRNMSSSATPAGIINTLNYMRIYGYLYSDGTYIGGSGDNCTYQLTSLTENNCTSWGNPMSEVFFEAIRYFASPKDGSGNPQPTPAYVYGGSSKDNELGLPIATWTDPLSQAQYCAPLNVLVFNAAVSSNEATTLTNPSDDLRTVSAAAINAPGDTIASLTNTVGTAEGITGGNYFVGKLVGTPATATTDSGFELCTAKTITSLGDVSGICPEGPTTAGSYLIAGIAHQAHTKPIRTDLTVPSTDPTSLKVATYGIQLATNVPQLIIPVPNSTKKVVIQPIYRLDLGPGNFGGGGLVDLRIVKQDVAGGTGKVYVNWEDSEQGGDYDQDMWGTIEWAINGTQITVKTNAISASTTNPQGFGYAISGTNLDGPHFHSGIYGFNFTDPSGVQGCVNCRLNAEGVPLSQVGPISVTYDIGATSAGTLQDPLWYAAKYGGFVDSNNNGMPDASSEWDQRKTDGTTGADTIPDNYFLVTNPLGLEQALGNAFKAILKSGSGAALASNSTSLQTINALYQAKFSTGDWSGQLLALGFDPDGTLNLTPKWDAATALTAQSPTTRTIVTFNTTAASRQGVPFRWPANPASPLNTEIGSALVTSLNTNPDTSANDGRGSDRLLYLRGDGSFETGPSAIFRQRPLSKLGDIVASSPIYVGAPGASTFDPGYTAFRNTNLSRTPMVYVGANDGMLHGFEASPTGTGRERLAYIPSKTFPNLAELTTPNYVHQYYVDGTPEVQDVFINTRLDPVLKWRTVLVGGLAGGGRGLYALDVTNPDGGGSSPAFNESNANRILLWEFNDTDDNALGLTYGKPVIRKMANGKWAAIVSGGYNNSDSRAYLFVIFLDGPKGGGNTTWQPGIDYIKIPTGAGSLITPNGLAPPFAADSDGDGLVNFVYAGDLLGNFWKFDVSSATAANWTFLQNRVNLLPNQARSLGGAVQPITAQAEGTFHPTGKGFVLTFGTGKYLEFTDTIPPYVPNTFYGIWDKNDRPGNVASQTTVRNRLQLLEQTITEATPGATTFRIVSNNTPVWSTDPSRPFAGDSPTKDMGWFIDLPQNGERSITRPILTSARLIFATTIPSNSTCDFGGSGFLMVVNPTTGGRIESVVLDVDGNGILNAVDKVNSVFVSGVKLDVGASGTPTIVRGGSGGVISGPYDVSGGSSSAQAYVPTYFNTIRSTPLGIGNDQGRVTWRELLTR